MSQPLSLSEQITQYLVAWRDRDWPIPWESVFENDRPVVVEIGMGIGEFLVHLAEHRPELNFVGIEISWEPIQNTFRRIEKSALENVRIFKGDASLLMENVLPRESVSEFHINFPDPWPKDRHQRRRLLQPDFVDMLTANLVEDGRVTLATDHDQLALWMSGILEAQSSLQSIHPTTTVNSLPNRIATKYERKFRALGHEVHYFEWQRAQASHRAQATRRIQEMPNVTFEGALDLDSIMGTFPPRIIRERNEGVDVVLNLRRIYQATMTGTEQAEARRDSQSKEHWIVEAFVQEGNFSQCFAVGITVHGPDKTTVRPAPLGFPRPTWGVKRAVREVAAHVAAHPKGMPVASSTVGAI